MINRVKIWSKLEMIDLLRTGISKYVDRGEVAIISILDTDAEQICPFHQNILTLKFDDVTPKMAYEYNSGMYKSIADYERKIKAITNDQSKEIISFVKKVHNYEQKISLFVHCSAGISRSGAVGKFAAEYFKNDMQAFNKANPNIMPNSWVENILWGEINITQFFK